MLKSRKFVFSAVILSLLLFAMENWYINHFYPKNSIADYAKRVVNSIEEIEESVSAEVVGQNVSSYFWIQSLSADNITQLRSLHPDILDVILIDKNNHIFSPSGTDFPVKNNLGVLKNIRKSNKPITLLLDNGFYSFYPIFSEVGDQYLGVLILSLKVQGFHPDAITFFMPSTRSYLWIRESKKIAIHDSELLQSALQEVSITDDSSFSISLSRSWAVHWAALSMGPLFVGVMIPAQAFYTYLSFYISILLFIILAVLEINTKSKTMSNTEVIKMILEKNHESLANLKSNMSKIEESIMPHSELIMEKSVVGKIVTDKTLDKMPTHGVVNEEDLQDAVHTFDTKEFILLDPLNEEWIEPVEEADIDFGKYERTEELKERAFSPELMNLLDEVRKSKEDRLDKSLEEFEKFEESFETLYLDEYGQILRRLYEAKEPVESLSKAFDFIRNEMMADGLCLMLFDKNLGCYSMAVTSNISDSMQERLYLLHRDPVIELESGKVLDTEIDDSIRADVFFRKRFNEEEAANVQFIRSISLHDFQMNACLLAFYNKESEFESDYPQRMGKWTNSHFQLYVQGIIPAISKLYHGKISYKARYPYKELIDELKGFTTIKGENIKVLHVRPKAAWSDEALQQISQECRSKLKTDERMIISTPSHIVFFTEASYVEPLQTLFKTRDEEVDLEEHTYPDEGRSFFIYI